MNCSPNLDQLDELLHALANKHRRGIIDILSLQPQSISQLAKQQDLSLPAIHKHIDVLEEAKLVIRKKSGRVNFLALNSSKLLPAQQWIGQFRAYWGSEAATLENYVTSLADK